MRVISIANQKGGVGKTTTTLNFGVALQTQGKRVLCIDFDPQCHLGKYIGHKVDDKPTIADCLFAKASYYSTIPTDGLIRHSRFDGLDYIPSSLKLSKADMVLAQAMFRESVLADVLALIPLEHYDYVLIDCNPSMGVLLTNALIASDGVIIPVQAEDFATDGLADMLELIRLIQAQGNPKLELIGMLPTMVTSTKMSDTVLAELQNTYPELVFRSSIRRSIDASGSTRTKTPLVGSKSKLGGQYLSAAKELLERLEGKHDE